MARADPALTSFNAGELSDQMSGRFDVDKYAVGCKTLENFIPLLQGPAMRRAGTHYVAELKDSSDRCWLQRFEFSATQAFVLEFGDLYVRFYTDHGVLLSAGVPYEIVSPYAVADLTNSEGAFTLNIEQSGDVLYIAAGAAGPGYPPYTLTRVSNTNWVFAVFSPTDGPFLEINTGTTTVYASANTGSVTLTASASLFAATDVGRLIRLDVGTYTVLPWETNIAYNANDLVRSGGMTYKALNSATSGTSAPVHLYGSAYDGATGVQWAYQDSGYGIAKITAYTNATTVTALVITDDAVGLNVLPSTVVGSGTPTKRWFLGAWSATTEYPRTVAFFNERLFWSGKLRWWGSVPSLYTSYTKDFNGLVTTDASVYGILSAQDVNGIVWMTAANLLLIGTQGGEFGLGRITTTNPLGPENIQVVRQSKQRCRSVRPELIGTSVLYVQRAARKVLALDYNFYLDRYDSTNQTRLASHVTQSGLIDIAYQAEPYQVLWGVRADGQLVGYTFDREDNVTGWHRHLLGGDGEVESICVVPAPDGVRDELWLIVKRTIGGNTRRYVEYLEKHYEPGDTQDSCFYVDCGATYDGVATTTISGLNYLEGETVSVFADGGVRPNVVVTSGAITLEQPASIVNVGLPYTSTLVTMRIEAGGVAGTSQGMTKRVHMGTIRLVDTLGGQFGMENGVLDDITLADPAVNLDEPPPIFTADMANLVWPGDYDTDCRLKIVQSDPCPMTVAGLFPNLKADS